jgi:hypothetical protein
MSALRRRRDPDPPSDDDGKTTRSGTELTVMMANIPFRSFADVIGVVGDNGEPAAAIQQAF